MLNNEPPPARPSPAGLGVRRLSTLSRMLPKIVLRDGRPKVREEKPIQKQQSLLASRR
jgi:hypothetical protein